MIPGPPRSTLFPYPELFRSSGIGFVGPLPQQLCPLRGISSNANQPGAARAMTEFLGSPEGDGCLQSQRLDPGRSEEHTSELQSPCNSVFRLMLETKHSDTHQ